MIICVNCGKRPKQVSYSRHQKGSSGATEWPLRAQIVKHTQKPNLHSFKGLRYCTKCLRIAKKEYNKAFAKPETPQVTP